MDYDLTNSDTALKFCQQATGLSRGDFINEYAVNSGGCFEKFWDRNESRLEALDVRTLRCFAFHVLGSLDDCRDIRETGLRNLQYVLSNDTSLANNLRSCGVTFDIEKRIMCCDGKAFCVDYDYWRNQRRTSMEEDALESIAHRVFYDFCIDGFLYNDEVAHYGTDIHKRPEFLISVGKFSKRVQKLDAYWKAASTSYKVRFFATLDQIPRFQFESLKGKSSEYCESDMPIIKKWLMIWAIDRVFDNCNPQGELLYIQDDAFIPPEQIVSYDLLF